MRGFKETKQANSPVLGEAVYSKFISDAKRENNTGDKRLARARAYFNTPPYCIGERRKEYERRIHEKDIESLKHRLETVQGMGRDQN